MGDGGQLLFPSFFQTIFNFLPGLRVSFQRLNVGTDGSILGKKWSLLFIDLDRVLSLSGN